MSKAAASPNKRFFVHMITRDISLEACILDLLDNSVDGARDDLRRRKITRDDSSLFEGYFANITFDDSHFEIRDNCGGIPMDDAINYAFNFGRPEDAPAEADFAIGLYGIGMKRAVFKMGASILVASSTAAEAFEVNIEVPDWLRQTKRIKEIDSPEGDEVIQVEDWSFPLTEATVWDAPGTELRVEDLYEGIADDFGDSTFADELIEILARDYSFILQKGFSITVNGSDVEPHAFELSVGGGIIPANYSQREAGQIDVRIVAGIAVPPQDDVEAEAELNYDPDFSGWFVLCNDRVILAADKSERTGWGTKGLPRWHSQYNGFVGIVSFHSVEPDLLPWDTTKRNVELSHPTYRRALTRMKDAARPYVAYTNLRKGALDQAKVIEGEADSVSIFEAFEMTERLEMGLPELPDVPKVKMATIRYRKPPAEVEAVKEAAGDPGLTQAEVGLLTFNYFRDKFVGR